jgi:hypothetical protein
MFYSPALARHIAENSDYLEDHYSTGRQIQSHINDGTIVSFSTSSPGVFRLRFPEGSPNDEEIEKREFKLKLGLQCRGGTVCFRDYYDLMEWHSHCPPEQEIRLPEGNYEVTLCSDVPKSGIIGRDQVIDIYFKRVIELPRTSFKGIPELCF